MSLGLQRHIFTKEEFFLQFWIGVPRLCFPPSLPSFVTEEVICTQVLWHLTYILQVLL